MNYLIQIIEIFKKQGLWKSLKVVLITIPVFLVVFDPLYCITRTLITICKWAEEWIIFPFAKILPKAFENGRNFSITKKSSCEEED